MGRASVKYEDKCRELEQENERLREGLGQALRQWRMYANTERQFDEDWIEGAHDEEAQIYARLLSLTRPKRVGEGARKEAAGVGGASVSYEELEKQAHEALERLEGTDYYDFYAHFDREEAIFFVQAVLELLRENEMLRTARDALRVLKDPEQKSIPFDKVKADLRIQALEQENERLQDKVDELKDYIITLEEDIESLEGR